VTVTAGGAAVGAAISTVLRGAGCSGSVAALAIDGPGAVFVDADIPAVSASVVKVSIALEVLTAFTDGRLDPLAVVELPVDNRTPGPTGLSASPTDASATLGELVAPMLAISDNEAADVLLHRVGIDAVNTRSRSLGLADSIIVSDLRTMIASLAHDTGFPDWAAMTAWTGMDQAADDLASFFGQLVAARALNPAAATRTTAADTARLLRLVCRGEAGPVDVCAQLRALLAGQANRTRIASGFPPDVRVAAKSGSLMGVVRNEAGIVTDPDGRSWAVAVFTRADRPYERGADIDAAISEVAARAVAFLRATT